MFEGEMASLTAILETHTVKAPRPLKVLDAPGGGSMLVMEHLDMKYLGRYVRRCPSGWLCFSCEWFLHTRSVCLGSNFGGCGTRSRGPALWVLQNE